jgi:hypothetical protein
MIYYLIFDGNQISKSASELQTQLFTFIGLKQQKVEAISHSKHQKKERRKNIFV